MELQPSLHNMLTNLQRNATLKIIHKSFWVFIKLRLKFCHSPRKMEDGRFKRDTGNELIPDVIHVFMTSRSQSSQKKHVDRMGTKWHMNWHMMAQQYATILRNTTRSALFHFFQITSSFKFGKSNAAQCKWSSNYIFPSIGAAFRIFQNLTFAEVIRIQLMSYLFLVCCVVLHT